MTEENTEEHKSKWKNDGKPKSRKMAVLLFGPIFLIIVGAAFYLSGDRYISTDNAYVKANKTSISTEVSGKVIKVDVKDNSRVKKGDELFLIDAEPFEIAVQRLEANLNKVRTDIESMRADYRQKLAELATTEESVEYQEREYKRYTALAAKQAVSKERTDSVHHDYLAAQKEREAAREEMESLKAKLAGNPDIAIEDHPNYKQAQAELEKAKLDLSRVKIVAPSDGIVANVTVEPGEYIATGVPLFTIVSDRDPWIEANFKETDLTHMHAGQHTEIEVDTYPGVTWDAKVVSVTPATGSEFSILPSQNSSGNWVKVVQRIMVRVELEDNKDKPALVAGMSTNVTVDTGISRFGRMFGNSK